MNESYGPRFVIVGSRSEPVKPQLPPKPNMPKRTPSRLDNARRWAPAAYARNHAEVNRRVNQSESAPPAVAQRRSPVNEFVEKELPPPPPRKDYEEQSTKPFYI